MTRSLAEGNRATPTGERNLCMKTQHRQDSTPIDGWLSDIGREAVRLWADRAVRGDEEGRRPPNCVIAFAARHGIPLDRYDHRVSGLAVQRVLRHCDAGRGLAP
jgi:hypothetical protein